ncbi:hypothetical protein ScPMuIL_009849 [Solemya velum]
MTEFRKSQTYLGSSLLDLGKEDDDVFIEKEKVGLLRRAFSSIKRKKSGRFLGVEAAALPAHKPLKMVVSNPNPPLQPFDSSPASDLAARRGVFSRRHYGSVELLSSCDGEGSVQSAGRFRVETGERDGDEVSSPLNSPIHLENPEFQTRWYFKYFLGKLHQNYVGADSEKEPFLLSVIVTDASNHNVLQYRSILWRKTGAQRICLPYNQNKPHTVKSILSHFDLEKLDKGPKEIFDSEIQKELLVLEEQEGSVNFKFGVVYVKDGQTADDDFYSNEKGNEAFHKFLKLLGDRIDLKGWDKFKAGLDVKSNTTGDESVYTVYEGHEIMFHVSTLLPHSKDNKQQVERKRHIGNDIVNIIFFDCDPNKAPSFKPSMMKTRFTHIFAVVTYNPETLCYRLIVYTEESVPLFGPPLPCPPVFFDHREFRDFLLVKLINGEKAAVNNPLFAQKRERTLEMLLRNLYQIYVTEVSGHNNMLNRRAFSDVIQDTHCSRRKEDTRRAKFVREGQTLKLNTILKGDAPTSMVTTGLLKREPWEPQLCRADFPSPITCGDKLVVTCETGTMLLEEGLPPRLLFDRTVPVKQISVVEGHGLLIMRMDKGKDGRVNVFRLCDIEGENNEGVIKSRADCKEHKIERTKGCHLYALSRPCSSHLRMVVCIGKRLQLFLWKHNLAWSTWCPSMDQDTVDEFTFIRELQAFDVPQLVTLIDGSKDDNHICVGYKNQFDLINEKNGDTLQLYHAEANKVCLVSALDIYEDEEAELLLCYNHVSHFQKLREETSRDFDFYWNAEPSDIGYYFFGRFKLTSSNLLLSDPGLPCYRLDDDRAIMKIIYPVTTSARRFVPFPYVMAFTPDSVEIRLIINGNLVHTMTFPHLTLITSKYDIFFASSTGPGNSPTSRNREDSLSPPSSPLLKPTSPPLNIFRIPISCLTGQGSVDKSGHAQPTPHQQTLLAPLLNSGDPSPGQQRRTALQRAKCVTVTSGEREKDRHDSSSSDSGITILRPCDNSPPESPFFRAVSCTENGEQETDLV